MASSFGNKSNFWQQLSTNQQPIIGLSPMDGVSDQPFRFITKKYGKPDVIFTEFTSVEGICHGATTFTKEFLYDLTQRPIVAQIFGTEPECFYQATIMVCELGFDGVDINMGCPAKNVAQRGAGAGLIRTPELAAQIVRAVQRGVADWSNGAALTDCPDIPDASVRLATQLRKKIGIHTQSERRLLPVSIKTRVGYDAPVTAEWISHLLLLQPAAITLHGRTLKQQYGGNASWEEIGTAARLTQPTSTLLLGNGDVSSRTDADHKIAEYQTNGVLIGRASFGNPYVFLREQPATPSLPEIGLEHAQLYEHTYQDQPKYSFLAMRKHLGWYIRNFPDASSVRAKLFQATTATDVSQILCEANLISIS
jgi:tRNA-dihydrouridine synthase